ncbi:MAG: T9SS type A sorting domain-containing protein [Bacteroidales bacterium]
MRKILFFLAFILLSIVINAQTLWTQQTTNMSGTSIGVDQISAVDSNIVWINGFNGSGTTQRAKLCSHTQNGGSTWTAASYNGFGATVFPYVLCGVTYNKAFAIAMDTVSGGLASFWKTIDGGTSWSLVSGVMNTGSTTFADGVMFWGSDKGFCYGDPVNSKFDIYYTTDSGSNWTAVLAANVPLPLSGEFGYNGFEYASKMEGGSAAFLTNMGRVFKTSNYGVNWTVTATAPFTTVASGKIYLTGINSMIVAGMATGATALTWKQSTDNGASWTSYSPIGNFYTYSMTYVPNSSNMLVSTSPYSTAKGVSYSNDGGANWSDYIDPLLQTSGVNNQCLGVGFADPSHGWVGNYSSLSNSILKVVITLPGNATNINGPTTVCKGQNSVIYTVPLVANATSYIWTIPAGATGTSITSGISVNYGASAVSGNITVRGHNVYGNGAIASLAVTVNPPLPTPIITQTLNTLSSSAAVGNQWYELSTGIISSATSQTFTPQQSGDYFTIVSQNGCISDSSNIIHLDFTGIGLNTAKDISIRITPNPAQDVLYLKVKGVKEKLLIEIFDMLGKSVYTEYIITSKADFNKEINVGKFDKGIFFIKISNNQLCKTEKIVLN